MTARLDELWERHLAGEALSPAEEKELLDALSRDPALRADLLEDERIDGTLAMIGRDAEDFVRSFDHRMSLEGDADRFARRVAPRLGTDWRPLLTAAAVILIAAAVYLLWSPSEPPPVQTRKPVPQRKIEEPPRPIPPPVQPKKPEEPKIDRARIEEELRSAIRPRTVPPPPPPPLPPPPPPPAPTVVKEPEPAPKPTVTAIGRVEGLGDLVAGQRLLGPAVVVFPDKTRIELGPDTPVTVDSSKKLSMEKGTLRAEVTRQPKDQPLVVQTPHGDAKVIGTALRLVVDATSTRLEVEEGKVELRNAAKKAVTVGAGEYAIAAAGAPLVARRPAVSFDLDWKVLKSRLEDGAVVQTPQGPVLRTTPFKAELWSSQIAYWAGSEDVITFTLKKSSVLRFRYFLKSPSEINFRIKNLTKREYFTLDFQGVVGRWVTVTVPVMEIPVITDGLKVACEPGDKYGRWSFLVGTPQQPAELDVAEFRVFEMDR